MDIQRGQVRSKSLENLTNIGSVKHEKSIYGNSLSPHTNVFQGLKRRVIEGLKLSRSNQDVTSSGSVDENRKHLLVQSNSSPFEMEKRQRDEKSKSSLKLDGRKRSRTLVDGSQHGGGSHTQTPSHEPLSNQISLGDGNISRARSFTGESNDQFVLVDTISIDGSVDGNVGPYDAYDEADGASGAQDNERVNHEIEKLKQKIYKTKKQLVEMQNTKADNVQEFLESANQKNKVNFEKRQQKTNANIQQMQKKLDKYQKMLKDLEERGVSQHRAKEMFRGVHVAVKAGASSISEVVAKPIESMNKLIKKDRRVGSADNLGTTISSGILGEGSSTHIDETEQGFLNCSDDDTSSISSIPNIPFNLSGSLTGNSIHQSCAAEIERLQNQSNEISLLRKENEELRETVHKLKEQLEIMADDERDRHEYLQTQIRDLCNQYNDLTELHQQEVMEIKEEIYKANDKIDCVDYRSAERAAEIEDLIDSFSTSVKKIGTLHENEQQPFLDGYVEGNGTAKILISKVLSLVVSLCAIILVIVSLVARVISPFTSTWKRAVLSFSCVLLIVVLWRSTDRPILQQLHHKASDLILIAYDKVSRKAKFTKGVLRASQR